MAVSNASIDNYGDGPQNAQTGDGPQNNNNGKGLQINNSILHGVNLESTNISEAERLRKEKEDCLISLCYKNIRSRKADISAPHNNTCDWLFNNDQFQKWYYRNELTRHNGVLWIKGHPGTGKSTLMKHTLNYCQKNLSDTHIIVDYFFNARGDSSEQTPLGMLRSIWYQLLAKEQSIYQRFVPLFREKRRQYKDLWDLEWQESELKDLLLSEVQRWQSNPLLILIDALDECSELDVRDVVKFLESLSIDAFNANRTLNICLSSRHYPYISMRKHLSLIVETVSEHEEDIVAYVKDTSKYNNKMIEEKIIEKASGNFLWAVLVINMLNEAYDKGQIDTMQKKFLDVPRSLENMFGTLLTEDNPDKHETIFMLQFVLSARRPIRAEELYHAMLTETSATKTDAWCPTKITQDAILRRITNSSRGLIEVRKDGENTIQFIHQSVNDFLIRGQDERLKSLDPAFNANPLGVSHERMRSCCLKYIMKEVSQPAKGRTQACNLGSSYPFLVYASTYIFDHAEEAERKNIEQADFLKRLLVEHDTLERIRSFHHAFEDYVESECMRGVGLLHMLAAHGCNQLAQTLLTKGTKVNSQGGRYGTALHIAAAHHRDGMVALLLENGADVNAQGGIYGSALQAAAGVQNTKIVKILLDAGANVNAQGGIYGNAIQAAAAESTMESVKIVEILLEAGANINAQGGIYGNALQAAVAVQNIEIIRVLLEKGADVNAQGGIYSNALQAGIAVSGRGRVHDDTLQAAAAESNEKIADMLLEAGANVNAQGGIYDHALEADETVKAKGRIYGDTFLVIQAAFKLENGIVKMLLEEGANVNAQGGIYGNALQAAAAETNLQVVEMLLEKGADVNAQGGIYNSALQAAAASQNKEIIKQLLDAGANVNAQGGIYGNILQAAAAESNIEIVEMLLEAGANINAEGGMYGSALQAAAVKGDEEVVKILLERGADINTLEGCLKIELEAAILKSQKCTATRESYFKTLRWKVLVPKTQREVTTALQRRAYYYGEIFGAPSQAETLKHLKSLLEERKDANSQMILDAVFWLAVATREIRYAAKLADEGANINFQMPGYPSAIELAIVRKEGRAIAMLFDKGALIKAHHNIESGTKFRIYTSHIFLCMAWLGLIAFGYFMRQFF